jgi:hypothetical protein
MACTISGQRTDEYAVCQRVLSFCVQDVTYVFELKVDVKERSDPMRPCMGQQNPGDLDFVFIVNGKKVRAVAMPTTPVTAVEHAQVSDFSSTVTFSLRVPGHAPIPAVLCSEHANGIGYKCGTKDIRSSYALIVRHKTPTSTTIAGGAGGSDSKEPLQPSTRYVVHVPRMPTALVHLLMLEFRYTALFGTRLATRRVVVPCTILAQGLEASATVSRIQTARTAA